MSANGKSSGRRHVRPCCSHMCLQGTDQNVKLCAWLPPVVCLSPYFTAAPGGDKEHRVERLPRRGEESSLVHPFSDNSPSQSYHVLLTRQSNSGPLNFTLNWWRSSPCQSLRDFRRSSKAKEHNEWKAPSQIDFKLNQTLVFNYLPQLPELNRGTLKLYIRRERKKGVRKWGEGEGGPGAECKWLHPCVVSEQVALW